MSYHNFLKSRFNLSIGLKSPPTTHPPTSLTPPKWAEMPEARRSPRCHPGTCPHLKSSNPQSHLGVSKNTDTSKWMVKIMENPIKMGRFGGPTPIFGNTHLHLACDVGGIALAGDGLVLLAWMGSW